MCKFVVVLFVFGCVFGERQPAVKTPLGQIVGYHMKTRGGRNIAAFTGIPYAVPPLGDLRFKVTKLNIFAPTSHLFCTQCIFFVSFLMSSLNNK